jgi:sRNA-binding regulator protein Hfq
MATRRTPPTSGEVFAEDLEALLEGLDGITAARVVATDAGEIETIYVTARGDRDEAAVRRSVAAALMSRYSLAVDGWRIRVARLQAPAGAAWQIHRVEESLRPEGVHVTVELRRGAGAGGSLVGRARALPDRASRLRALAQATVDALRPTLAAGRRATVEAVSTVAIPDGEVVVVTVSVAGAGDSQRYAGAAVVGGHDAAAVIAATLDAVARDGERSPQRGWGMRDRREELESMRAQYRRLREPQRQMPSLGSEAESEPADEVDVTQIRPERPGGAAVEARGEPARAAGRGSMEDDFLRRLVSGGTPVHIRCRDGYEIPQAVVRDFGTYSLLVEHAGGRELVFKHGIIAIRPLRPD